MRSLLAALLFLLPALAAAQPLNAFSDVPPGHPVADAVNYLYSEGIIQGYPDGTFRPEATINRAEFTKIIRGVLTDVSTTPCESRTPRKFPDISWDDWFAQPVCEVRWKGIIDGYPDGTFRPGNLINVAEGAKIIAGGMSVSLDPALCSVNSRCIPDPDAPWYQPFVEALAQRNALPLSLPSLEAQLTRGDMAEIVYRIRTKTIDKPSHTYSSLVAGEAAAAPGAGPRFLSYDAGVIGNGQESVLFFHAPWCPNCRQSDAELTALDAAGKLAVNVYKVDYDTSPELKQRYGITVQDTFVRIGTDGGTVASLVSPSPDQLSGFLDH